MRNRLGMVKTSCRWGTVWQIVWAIVSAASAAAFVRGVDYTGFEPVPCVLSDGVKGAVIFAAFRRESVE
jgi:hypothetical protein